jgi:hypothetical protein
MAALCFDISNNNTIKGLPQTVSLFYLLIIQIENFKNDNTSNCHPKIWPTARG